MLRFLDTRVLCKLVARVCKNFWKLDFIAITLKLYDDGLKVKNEACQVTGTGRWTITEKRDCVQKIHAVHILMYIIMGSVKPALFLHSRSNIRITHYNNKL